MKSLLPGDLVVTDRTIIHNGKVRFKASGRIGKVAVCGQLCIAVSTRDKQLLFLQQGKKWSLAGGVILHSIATALWWQESSHHLYAGLESGEVFILSLQPVTEGDAKTPRSPSPPREITGPSVPVVPTPPALPSRTFHRRRFGAGRGRSGSSRFKLPPTPSVVPTLTPSAAFTNLSKGLRSSMTSFSKSRAHPLPSAPPAPLTSSRGSVPRRAALNLIPVDKPVMHIRREAQLWPHHAPVRFLSVSYQYWDESIKDADATQTPMLVTGSASGSVSLYNIQARREARVWLNIAQSGLSGLVVQNGFIVIAGFVGSPLVVPCSDTSQTPRPFRPPKITPPIRAVLPIEQNLVGVIGKSGLEIWNCDSRELVQTLQLPGGPNAHITKPFLREDGMFFSSGGVPVLLSRRKWESIWDVAPFDVSSIAINDRTSELCISARNLVLIYSLRSGRLVRSFSPTRLSSSTVTGLALGPRFRRLMWSGPSLGSMHFHSGIQIGNPAASAGSQIGICHKRDLVFLATVHGVRVFEGALVASGQAKSSDGIVIAPFSPPSPEWQLYSELVHVLQTDAKHLRNPVIQEPLTIFSRALSREEEQAERVDISALTVSSELDLVAYGTSTGTIRVHDTGSRFFAHISTMRHFPTSLNESFPEITSLAFIPSTPILVSADSAGLVCFWSTRPAWPRSHLLLCFRHGQYYPSVHPTGVDPFSRITGILRDLRLKIRTEIKGPRSLYQKNRRVAVAIRSSLLSNPELAIAMGIPVPGHRPEATSRTPRTKQKRGKPEGMKLRDSRKRLKGAFLAALLSCRCVQVRDASAVLSLEVDKQGAPVLYMGDEHGYVTVIDMERLIDRLQVSAVRMVGGRYVQQPISLPRREFPGLQPAFYSRALSVVGRWKAQDGPVVQMSLFPTTHDILTVGGDRSAYVWSKTGRLLGSLSRDPLDSVRPQPESADWRASFDDVFTTEEEVDKSVPQLGSLAGVSDSISKSSFMTGTKQNTLKEISKHPPPVRHVPPPRYRMDWELEFDSSVHSQAAEHLHTTALAALERRMGATPLPDSDPALTLSALGVPTGISTTRGDSWTLRAMYGRALARGTENTPSEHGEALMQYRNGITNPDEVTQLLRSRNDQS
eukprot:gnl/Dysnectes_brevis/8455_a15034_176.p1 GENE.gnl/Dysnectes_brevis/8455_a15034_176~~gnl/Dysnectes_brevis/8455_a15034_176.p1  ORF type:complete len:1170 (+),score=315.61 gnl/Dysnectes_brevis/8455_a15034_176:148-3510(+)